MDELEDKKEIGERLALLESMYGLRGQELARQFGVPKQTWSRYRNGESFVPYSLARAMRDKLGCTLDWIFLGDAANCRPDFLERLKAANRPRWAGATPAARTSVAA